MLGWSEVGAVDGEEMGSGTPYTLGFGGPRAQQGVGNVVFGPAQSGPGLG